MPKPKETTIWDGFFSPSAFLVCRWVSVWKLIGLWNKSAVKPIGWVFQSRWVLIALYLHPRSGWSWIYWRDSNFTNAVEMTWNFCMGLGLIWNAEVVCETQSKTHCLGNPSVRFFSFAAFCETHWQTKRSGTEKSVSALQCLSAAFFRERVRIWEGNVHSIVRVMQRPFFCSVSLGYVSEEYINFSVWSDGEHAGLEPKLSCRNVLKVT